MMAFYRLTAVRRAGSRRRWPIALAGLLIPAGILVPVAARPAAAHSATVGRPVAAGAHRASAAAPTEVIDANADPTAAAAALTKGCADMSHCTWETSSVTAGWSPLSILGDELYNCSTPGPGTDDTTAVGVSDQRGETTNISERVSVMLQGALIKLASFSATFTAFSKQSSTFSTKVTTTNTVTVPAGWKGYNTSQALSALVTGNTYITDGIHLIEVKDVDMTLPGYQVNSDRTPQPTIVNGVSAPMTSDDIVNRCDKAIANPTAGAPKPPTGRFDLMICQRGGGCSTRTVVGPPPPTPSHPAEARLTADGVLYAVGKQTNGGIRLTVKRAVSAGSYKLTIRESLGHHGDTADYRTTEVPVKIP